MTLIVDVLSRAARQVSLPAPSSWVSATADEYVEIRDDFLLDTVDDLLERVDLPSPIGAQTTITGDGSETYSLPSDFVRLQRDMLAVYEKTLDRACTPVVNDGHWTHIKEIGTSGVERYFRVSGYEGNYSISFYMEPAAANEIVVSYITHNWMANSGGTAGKMFTSAEDVLLLPRRAVEAGIIWRWRERKGMPFQDKYMEYEALVARLSNDSRQRRVINFGARKMVRWQDQIPAYIPEA